MTEVGSPKNLDSSGRARWALAGLSLALLLSSLGTSIANVALPSLAEAFEASFQTVRWVVLAYLLTLTASIVGVGLLGDRIGRGRILRIGIVLFTAASAVAGGASALSLVITARAVQGLGAAIMMAMSMALVGELIPKAKTGSAMGLLGTMSAIGTALGPSLGGVLIAWFGWRAIFLINVPLGLAAVLLVHRYLPADRLATAQAREGLGAGRVLAMLRDPTLSSSLLANLMVSAVLMTTLVVGPFYLSITLALAAGLLGLVMSLGPIVAALTGIPAGRVVDRFGAHRMVLVGLGAIATGSFILSGTPETLGIAGYVAPIVFITAGYALFQAANNTALLRDVDAGQRGVVSGMLSFSRNLGLITGTSAMGAVFGLALGTNDITAASPEAVAAAMRITFAVAAALIMVAMAIVAGGRVLAARWKASALALALLLSMFSSVAAAQEPAAHEGPAQTDAPRSSDDRGFVLRSANGANRLRILGLLQPQLAQDWSDGVPDKTTFVVNRARIGLVGSVLSEDLQYMFVTEFGGGNPRLLFLNVDYALVPDWLTIRVGQFKRPFSRPFIAFASQLSMIDRPLTVGPSVFGDDADIGVMLHNGTAGRFEYALGVFNGTGPNVVPDRVHPLLALRVGYNTGGLDPYSESDLEGGAPRFSIAAAGLVDFDEDEDDASFTSALVDMMVKAHGFSLTSAVYAGTRQSGSRWSDQRLHALGHYTQLGYVIADRFEPVARYSLLLRQGVGNDQHEQHDLAGGLNVFFRGHAFKWQNFVSVRVQPHGRELTRDLSFQSQLSLSF